MTKRKEFIKVVSIILLVSFIACVLPVGSWAQGNVSEEEARKKIREEEKERKKILQIYSLLEKGRKERNEHNYKAARNYGKKALKLDPDSRLANAFLEQLDV
ncbi:hypothetical protein ACFL5E_04190, partial [Candidatus Omnitrophota bacterium]